MGLMSFYKPKKPTKFRYIYRYHDPKKEEMQRKINRAVRKLDPDAEITAEEVKENLKGAFHRQSDTLERHGYDPDSFQESVREKTWKNLLFLVLLIVFFIWLYSSVGEKFFSYLGF